MSKVQVLSIDGKPKGEASLGQAFKTAIRKDIVQRVFVSEQAGKRQPYGTDPLAGDRSSAHYHGSRHVKWTMMKKEMPWVFFLPAIFLFIIVPLTCLLPG